MTETRIAASRLTYQSVRRERTVSNIVGIARCRADGVAGSAARVYQLHGVPVVDLAAQPLNVDLDQVRHRVEAVVPDMLGDVRAPDDLVVPPHEILDQRVLLGGQRQDALATH